MHCSLLAVLQGLTDDSPEIYVRLSNLFQKVQYNITFDQSVIHSLCIYTEQLFEFLNSFMENIPSVFCIYEYI